MGTLKRQPRVNPFVGLVLAINLSCAMERVSSTRNTLVSKTVPEAVETGSQRSILRESWVRDTILQVRLLSYTQCRKEWSETLQETVVTTERPYQHSCGETKTKLTAGIVIGALLTVLGTGIIIGSSGAESSKEQSDKREAGYAVGGVLAGGGVITLSWTIPLKVYCAKDPEVTEGDGGQYAERQHGEAYNCGWKALRGVDVGVMLASGVVIRASTDEEGVAYFDLAGADPEDTAKMTLYVPQYEIIEPVALNSKEQQLLAFALLPKQSAKLSPVYGEIKSEARHAAIACYEDKFADNPVGGTITVSVEVAPSGRVRRLSGDFDPGSLSAANACLWDKLGRLKFEPWQGEALAVRVPVNFEAPPPPVVLSLREPDVYSASPADRRTPPPPPPPPPAEPKKKVETVLVGGTPVVFVHDPSLGCTAGVAACQAAIMATGGCGLIRREARRAVGGLWGIAAGAAAGAVCDKQMQEICAKAVCGN